MAIGLKVANLSGFNDYDKGIIEKATWGVNYIFTHPRFKEEILSRQFTETQGLSNQGIYDCIEKGDQLNLSDELGVLDLKLVMYNSWFSRVVGYTYLTSLTIWINAKFFAGPKSVGSNLAHEAMHQLGFTHNNYWASSVPYQMNEIIEKLWKELGVKGLIAQRF